MCASQLSPRRQTPPSPESDPWWLCLYVHVWRARRAWLITEKWVILAARKGGFLSEWAWAGTHMPTRTSLSRVDLHCQPHLVFPAANRGNPGAGRVPHTRRLRSHYGQLQLGPHDVPPAERLTVAKVRGQWEKNNNKAKAWLIPHTLHRVPLNLSIPMCHENQCELGELPAAGSVFWPGEQWIMGATSLWGFAPAHNLEEWFSKDGYRERYFLGEISEDVKVPSKSRGTAKSGQERLH